MSWNINLAQFATDVAISHEQKVKAVAITCLRHLVNESPRDTGTYANNHHISFDNPDPRYVERDRGNQNEVISFFGGDPTTKIATGQNFHTIYIQNNLPYAEYLEHGTDKMPPQNIYAKAIQATKAEYGIT